MTEFVGVSEAESMCTAYGLKSPPNLIPFFEARADQKKNPSSQWQGKHDSSATSRYGKPCFPPALGRPKFTICPADKFFMIGSCFARGLEAALAVQRFSVLSRTTAFDQWPTVRGSPAGATNKYNIASIENEISWAFGLSRFPDAGIVDLGNGTFSDPHMTPVFSASSQEEVLKRRDTMTSVVRTIFDADVVVMTLGLIEVWWDRKTGLITNSVPHPLVLRHEPDRFMFCRLNYSHNLSLLERVYEILTAQCSKPVKLILTVSPVPLEATFTSRDVVEATTYSKSLLRVVAEDFANSHDNVEYFPSFEIVMNSPRQNTWMEDCRHVRGDLAKFIMTNFILHYMPEVKVDAIKPRIDTESLE